MTKDTKEIAYWQDGTWCLKEDLYKFPLKTLERHKILEVHSGMASTAIDYHVANTIMEGNGNEH